jgi:NodT family efflux transporter outer membrane factor (OMF) lipoprotein
MSRNFRGLHVIIGAALVASCAGGPNYRAPKPDVPANFAAAQGTAAGAGAAGAGAAGAGTAGAGAAGAGTAGAGTAASPGGPAASAELADWWRSLGDAELDALVDRAIRSNPDIEIALMRLQAAREYEAVVLGHALPAALAGAAAARGTGTDLTRGRAPQTLVSADNTNGLKHINEVGGFDATWEIDLFGKYRRSFEAARADAQAAAGEREDVLASVVADVVRADWDLRGFQWQAAILHKADDVLRESLRVVKIRYERGIVNELDVTLASRELATLEAGIAPVEARAHAAAYTLAALLGEFPEKLADELATPKPLPALPGAISAGAPLDLLERRADLRAAERRLAASTARIGVATASLFPQVAVSGAIGAQAQGWGTSPYQGAHIWSFGPSAVWPLLDFGALDAEIEIARLQAHGALVAYRRTIVNAVEQVDTALDAYSAEQSRGQDLATALAAAQRAVELANQRYDRGLTDYLNVVDAQRTLYDVQNQYVLAQIAAGEQFVQLYKSLGGGWQNYQQVPPVRRAQPAVIAAFRSLFGNDGP